MVFSFSKKKKKKPSLKMVAQLQDKVDVISFQICNKTNVILCFLIHLIELKSWKMNKTMRKK